MSKASEEIALAKVRANDGDVFVLRWISNNIMNMAIFENEKDLSECKRRLSIKMYSVEKVRMLK